jgi:regulator of RNase E activity RraB
MTESEIKAIIRGHEKRNPELLRYLGSKGVSLNKARPVEHHFWANAQNEAAMLAKALYESGYLVLAISPVTMKDSGSLWNVEAGVNQPPSVAASMQLSEELTRLANQFNSVYDGWGTML